MKGGFISSLSCLLSARSKFLLLNCQTVHFWTISFFIEKVQRKMNRALDRISMDNIHPRLANTLYLLMPQFIILYEQNNWLCGNSSFERERASDHRIFVGFTLISVLLFLPDYRRKKFSEIHIESINGNSWWGVCKGRNRDLPRVVMRDIPLVVLGLSSSILRTLPP